MAKSLMAKPNTRLDSDKEKDVSGSQSPLFSIGVNLVIVLVVGTWVGGTLASWVRLFLDIFIPHTD